MYDIGNTYCEKEEESSVFYRLLHVFHTVKCVFSRMFVVNSTDYFI